MKYVQMERLSLKSNSELNEKWVQDRIADDPSILGLGDVIMKDKERLQPRAGRLDLLLQDAESNRRFEVEVQLGKTDESHIIRTLEYWDIERKRYPQYDHTAVIVAEEVTSRFLNVISLFNGVIPLIAIQMSAFRLNDQVSLVFTTVLDQVSLGLVDEDEEVSEVTDRGYWEKRGSSATVKIADELFAIVQEVDPGVEVKYNKFYIGMAKDEKPQNFVLFRPRKKDLQLVVKLEKSEDHAQNIEESGLDLIDYNDRDRGYRIRIKKGEVKNQAEVLRNLFTQAHKERGV